MKEEEIMVEEGAEVPKGTIRVQRIFEQPHDAISFYCDLAQIMGTGNEVVMQLYEGIPGPPGPGGGIQSVRSRLRATITFNLKHAQVLGNLLRAEAAPTKTEQAQTEKGATSK